jgi:hypothetical protein
MNESEIYQEIMQRWGIVAQYGMLQEECAELIVAVNKFFRVTTDRSEAHAHICEELADVQNMINQFKPLFPDFEKVRIGKLERVSLLLKAGKDGQGCDVK